MVEQVQATAAVLAFIGALAVVTLCWLEGAKRQVRRDLEAARQQQEL